MIDLCQADKKLILFMDFDSEKNEVSEKSQARDFECPAWESNKVRSRGIGLLYSMLGFVTLGINSHAVYKMDFA